jgi:hypothetical protein
VSKSFHSTTAIFAVKELRSFAGLYFMKDENTNEVNTIQYLNKDTFVTPHVCNANTRI